MSHKQPRLSIGLPVYNGEKLIKEALDSLLAQIFEDYELIICDNASTDNTEEICPAYAASDKRLLICKSICEE
jgi:glycosyltransferase involved in cell wall biosynthesis